MEILSLFCLCQFLLVTTFSMPSLPTFTSVFHGFPHESETTLGIQVRSFMSFHRIPNTFTNGIEPLFQSVFFVFFSFTKGDHHVCYNGEPLRSEGNNLYKGYYILHGSLYFAILRNAESLMGDRVKEL